MEIANIFVNSIIVGILTGSVYGLIAIGLSLVFGVMNIINMAHGEFVMLGAYVSVFFWLFWNINPIYSLPISMIALYFLGKIIHKAVIESIVKEHELVSLMLTFGLSYLIFNSCEAIFSRDSRGINYLGDPIILLNQTISLNYIVAFALSLFLTVSLFVFLKFSLFGKAIRAVSQNSQTAEACGINVIQVRNTSFAIALMLAGAGGTIISMMWTVYPSMGWSYVLKAFAIVIVGGLGNVTGAFIASLIFGIVEHLSAMFITLQFSQIVPFLLIVIVLLVRPHGLLGKREAK